MRAIWALTLIAVLTIALAGCVIAPYPYYDHYSYQERHYRPYPYYPGYYYRHRYYPGYHSSHYGD